MIAPGHERGPQQLRPQERRPRPPVSLHPHPVVLEVDVRGPPQQRLRAGPVEDVAEDGVLVGLDVGLQRVEAVDALVLQLGQELGEGGELPSVFRGLIALHVAVQALAEQEELAPRPPGRMHSLVHVDVAVSSDHPRVGDPVVDDALVHVVVPAPGAEEHSRPALEEVVRVAPRLGAPYLGADPPLGAAAEVRAELDPEVRLQPVLHVQVDVRLRHVPRAVADRRIELHPKLLERPQHGPGGG
mmetsp:Transcript_11121/g.27325  ORF Transcript_11121/g.27325 Transcript_11121/m.27325 type:complete len:243 (+) Transcript_11121:520-1248(+)